jgi:hypothetical protein
VNQVLKRLVFALLSIACALLGLEALINVLYSLGNALGVRDSARESAMAALVAAIVTVVCFLLAYKFGRLAAGRKNSDGGKALGRRAASGRPMV